MDDVSYQYLNLENRWPRFYLSDREGVSLDLVGLARINGQLELAPLPGNIEPTGPELPQAEELAGPAGIGVDQEGNVYLADPARHQIIMVRACDGMSSPLRCLQGPGSAPGQLQAPRGVVVGPRHALYVADSGNHRIQVVDLSTEQVRAIWGQPDPYGEPQPGSAPGRLDTPWDLAVDSAGYIYVVDRENSRIQKFDAEGRVQPTFWHTMQGETPPRQPRVATIILLGEQERLLVVDDDPGETGPLLIYNLDGSDALDEEDVRQYVEALVAAGARPSGIAMAQGNLYVAQAGQKRMLVFGPDGAYVGVVPLETKVAGLGVDNAGRLLVHPGGGDAVQRLDREGARAEQGTFLAGPFSADPVAARDEERAPPSTRWERLQIDMSLPPDCHLQLYTCTVDDPDTVPSNGWTPAPIDAQDFLVDNPPGRYLWLRGTLQGNGQESPQLAQIRVTYDTRGWSDFLPAVYRRQAGALPQMLALLESALDGREMLIDDLPRLFDPQASPDRRRPGSWLDWLAGWLDFELDETWSESQRRQALAEAFALHGRRGTAEGLRRLIALYGGVTSHIEEPARRAALWQLGTESYLGFTTMLAPAAPEGAVVGTTAIADGSHLLATDVYGAPLFEDIAHHFCVRLYAADMTDDRSLERVREVVERERPAHMTYEICLIEARMRVGFQARIGVDTIVAGPSDKLELGEAMPLGSSSVLGQGAERHPVAGRVGQDSRIGQRTAMT